jgi:hypothetical protein
VHLRRGLLLFAVVLGMAALATSVSQPRNHRQSETEPIARPPESSPRAEPAPSPHGEAELRFLADGRREVLPGQVALDGLGLNSPADPSTPARFDVLVAKPRRVRVRFSPASSDEPQLVGTLRIVQPRQAATSSRSGSSSDGR